MVAATSQAHQGLSGSPPSSDGGVAEARVLPRSTLGHPRPAALYRAAPRPLLLIAILLTYVGPARARAPGARRMEGGAAARHPCRAGRRRHHSQGAAADRVGGRGRARVDAPGAAVSRLPRSVRQPVPRNGREPVRGAGLAALRGAVHHRQADGCFGARPDHWCSGSSWRWAPSRARSVSSSISSCRPDGIWRSVSRGTLRRS